MTLLLDMYRFLFLIGSFLGLFAGSSADAVAASPDPSNEVLIKTVVAFDGTSRKEFVSSHKLYAEGWDTLAQAKFWQQVISLSHDSMIVNIASERRVLQCVSADQWHCQTEDEKSVYKSNLCSYVNIPAETELYVTGGKKFFFEYTKALPMISRSIAVFRGNGTDPWYAQAILLIESPGKMEARSYVGARGPFQLMPAVARKYGLTVNKYHDDRTSLDKSALAASKLINSVCLPYAREILESHGISYNEQDTWFRLFVLHIYHAGAGNVRSVVDVINPTEGGMSLIRQMWVTQSRSFKNESQNYSQIALASMLLFDKMINEDKDSVFLVRGDRLFRKYYDKHSRPEDTLSYLNNCLAAYESDFIEGSVPFEYFSNQTEKIQKEIEKYYLRHGITDSRKLIANLDESERLHQLGTQLLYKKKVNEAIQVFQLGIRKNPISPATYDSLSYAYRLIGNNSLSAEYTRKSKQVQENPELFVR
ncbi:MAG TPA: transglycosylase SLT domain-containing protein [Bacteroidia bacterium]|nr:transglycosylase SLT domain-containing protein [Bacteroidia bacterium]